MAGSAHRRAVGVSAVLLGANAASYLLTIVAARLLDVPAFGELSALMALLVIGVVPAMSAQTGIALHVAGTGGGRAALRGSVGLGLAVGVAVAGVVALAAPALTAVLHLSGWSAALVLPLALLPFPVAGALAGVLQGRQRFGTLALLLGVETVGRAGGGIAGLVVGRTPAAVLVGVAAGMVASTVFGWLLCGRPVPGVPSRALVRRVSHAAYATIGLVLLLNLDVLLARHVLSAEQSGVYAVGLIVTKVAYWLPQAVGVLVLPRLADPSVRRGAVRSALLAVLVVDAPVVVACAAAGSWLLPLLGGGRYSAASAPLWLFALTGLLLAVAQILLYSRIAGAELRPMAAVWVAAAVEAVLVLTWLDGGVGQVAAAATVAAGLLVAVGLLVERGAGHPHGGGDDGADGGEHGELGGGAVRPRLPVPRQPLHDGDGGGDRHPGGGDRYEQAGPHLPQQHGGDQ
ncbi:O-antigen/teichoic acid export membrane protein [Spirilliplanes yamanashiensis]|nr:O-antigen/teichoic acid export membrane protein [Spirilliplanes yamanashiensis]